MIAACIAQGSFRRGNLLSLHQLKFPLRHDPKDWRNTETLETIALKQDKVFLMHAS